MNPCVALIGNSKSGRYLTWRILDQILQANGKTASFMADSGIVEEIPADVRARPYHFPDTERITGVDWQCRPGTQKRELCYWWPDPDQPHRYDVDLEDAVNRSNLISGPIWKRLVDKDPRMGGITHYVNIVRDGRDQLVSLAHFVMKAETQKRWPSNRRFRSSEEAFMGLFEYGADVWGKCAMDWFASRLSENAFCLRFEHLVKEKRTTCLNLMEFLGFEKDEDLADRIVDLTSVKKSREFSPDHVRKATTGDGRAHFTPEMEDRFDELSKGMLSGLGYLKRKDRQIDPSGPSDPQVSKPSAA